MNRKEAERVFALVAELKGDLRGRIVHQRWWLIWILAGVEMLVTCTITHALFSRGEERGWFYAVIWGIHIALIPVLIAVIQRRAGGSRTMVERQIWWIWATFIVSSASTAILNSALHLPLFYVTPTIALLASFAFAMMAMVVHLAFFAGTLLFFFMMILMAALPSLQFLIYGGAWFVTLTGLGLYYRPRAAIPSKPL